MFCSQTISVYVLMRHRVLGLGVQNILSNEQDLEVLVLPPDYTTTLKSIADFRPDVVITDVETCSLQSATELESVKTSGSTKFLFLYNSGEREAAEILALGADGVIAKSANADLLTVAVRALASGKVWIDENIWTNNPAEHVKAVVEDIENSTPSDEPVVASSRLSYREIEVLRLASEGYTNREIAKVLNLTHDTIKCCMWLIVRKLRARGRVHAVTVAKQCGIFS